MRIVMSELIFGKITENSHDQNWDIGVDIFNKFLRFIVLEYFKIVRN